MQSMLNISRLSEDALASITIRNLEDDLKRRLLIRGAEHGRSMEDRLEASLTGAAATRRCLLDALLAETLIQTGDIAA